MKSVVCPHLLINLLQLNKTAKDLLAQPLELSTETQKVYFVPDSVLVDFRYLRVLSISLLTFVDFLMPLSKSNPASPPTQSDYPDNGAPITPLIRWNRAAEEALYTPKFKEIGEERRAERERAGF
jgi:hypothetical protein